MQKNRERATPYLEKADIVIVGNGIAGLTAALEARSLAPEKSIAIITDQTHPTIHTPALKQFAIGKLEREQLLAHPAGTEHAERIHMIGGRVEEIHARSKYVTLDDKRGFGYGALLLATGSTPTGLPKHVPGHNFDGVMTLHRLQDYLQLRRRLSEVSEAVVIGGGSHAIETVMSLLHRGIHVNWLIRGSSFMSRVLDPRASEIVLARLRRAGVTILTETEVIGVVGRVGGVIGVVTNHQKMLPCQLVLSCTGSEPMVHVAQRCTLPIRQEHGILVDDLLHTNVRDIYAAGDVAALKNPLTGRYETRAQWYSAVSQGRVVGAVMAGHEELVNEPFGVQWHATHLGELSMLSVGSPLSMHEKVQTLANTGQGSYRRMAIVDNRLVGYLSLGMKQPDSLAIKRIIDEGHSIDRITKELLNGTFDARKYLSLKHAHHAQNMFATRVLPTLAKPSLKEHVALQGRLTRQLTASLQEYTNETEPLTAIDAHNAHAAGMSSYTLSTRQTEPMRIPDALEEEIGPFTGHLPASRGISAPRHAAEERIATTKLSSFVAHSVPSVQTAHTANKLFTDQHTSIAKLSAEKQHSGKLLAYANKAYPKKEQE